ncbi:MAG: recombinase family protein [Magnetococcales bacterium]|nr:recombinase family protein [Magnetococcales bacterium]
MALLTMMNHNKHKTHGSLIRAAQYVRISPGELQETTDDRAKTIKKFARKNGMKIVRTYFDDGRITRDSRDKKALQQMLHDVETGVDDYEVILVHDISIFGHFQNSDTSLYYENFCKQYGIKVEYCITRSNNKASHLSRAIKNNINKFKNGCNSQTNV